MHVTWWMPSSFMRCANTYHLAITRRRILVLAAATASAVSFAPGATGNVLLLGRSEHGRPIDAIRVGERNGPRVLVVGCIHGNEDAGIAIARALARTRPKFDLWIVPDLN